MWEVNFSGAGVGGGKRRRKKLEGKEKRKTKVEDKRLIIRHKVRQRQFVIGF